MQLTASALLPSLFSIIEINSIIHLFLFLVCGINQSLLDIPVSLVTRYTAPE
jgi:hypothetical protein